MKFDLLDELNDAQEEYQKLVRKKGEKGIKKAFKQFFDEYPDVSTVQWTQYTPYFMDGDPCIFGVNDLQVKFETVMANAFKYLKDGLKKMYEKSDDKQQAMEEVLGELEEGGDYGNGFFDEWGLAQTSLKKDFGDLNSAVLGMSDALENIFGDHVQITVTADEITTEEYSHD